MKFILTPILVFGLLLAVSAKPSKPAADCTATIVITPGKNETCDSVSAANGLTFPQLLTLNIGLDPNCDNLDDGNTICVGNGKIGKNGTSVAPSGSGASTRVPAASSGASSAPGASSVPLTASASGSSVPSANPINTTPGSNTTAINNSTSSSTTAASSPSGAALIGSPSALGMMIAAILVVLVL